MDYNVVRISPLVKDRFIQMGPKMKVNPYYGCTHACLFCPANDGFLEKKVFQLFRENHNIYVVENITSHIERYVEEYQNPLTIHLSPISDPFQSVEGKEKKTREILEYCRDQELPVAVCTKGFIEESYYDLIAANPNNFVQISLLSLNEDKRKFIVRGDGASSEQLLLQIEALINRGIKTVVRPNFPIHHRQH